jgi:hypothetical protein
MLPLQALEDACELIGCGWCQGVEARDVEGHRVEPWDAHACAWSLPGALLAVAERTGVDSRFLAQVGLSALALAIVGRVGELQEWNDVPERTVAEVLLAYEAACAMLPPPVSRRAVAQAVPVGTLVPSRAAVLARVTALRGPGLRRPARTAAQSSAQPLSPPRVAAADQRVAKLTAPGLRWRGAFGRRSGLLRALRTLALWALGTGTSAQGRQLRHGLQCLRATADDSGTEAAFACGPRS